MAHPLERLFPNLAIDGYRVTSSPSDKYNCIAWAAQVSDQWWWPSDGPRNIWPAGCLREETILAVMDAFRSIGYEPCEHGAIELGFEKIALYAVSEAPTHVARQLGTGSWTSKIGELEDIEHGFQSLEGPIYGRVAAFMKRHIGA